MINLDLSTIAHITADSRQVRAGSLFAALKGDKVDGTQFIAQAEAAGAVAVLCAEDAILPPTTIRVVRAREPRLSLSQIAAQFYPEQPAHLVAVTGTDGKTSTADFFRQLAHLAGCKSASIGTLGVFAGNGAKLYEGTHTTPDAIALHQMLQALSADNYTHVCMEASSHGLDQYRLHGARLEAAAFTNIARDHLDYHHTEENYFIAKAKLFSELLASGKTAVLNADDVKYSLLQSLCESRGHQIIDFGTSAQAFRIISRNVHSAGQHAACELLGKQYTLEIPLVGAFQLMNILAALGLLVGCGEPLDKLVPLIPKLQGVPGRLQHVANAKNGAAVYIDYAHTPAALANILRTIRPHTEGRLHVVFGCGGDRDSGKRPEMGKIANDLADVVFVTDDNPRSEDPAKIRASIVQACSKAHEIGDRKAAIAAAIKGLAANDLLVIAGKGHEKTQIIAGVEHPFDDADVAKWAAGQ